MLSIVSGATSLRLFGASEDQWSRWDLQRASCRQNKKGR